MPSRSLKQTIRLLPNEHGAILPMTALVMVAVVLFISLAVDAALFMRNRSELMTAGDLAALVGAAALVNGKSHEEAVKTARLFVEANLRAMGHSHSKLCDHWLPWLSVEIQEEGTVRRMNITQRYEQQTYFSSIVSSLGGKIPDIATASRASVNLGAVRDERPLVAVLLLDRALYMQQPFGTTCKAAPPTCLLSGQSCPAGCRPSIDGAVDAAIEVLNYLDPTDHFAIISFDSGTELLAPLQRATQHSKQEARQQLLNLQQELQTADSSPSNPQQVSALPDYASALWKTVQMLEEAGLAERESVETDEECDCPDGKDHKGLGHLALSHNTNVAVILLSGGGVLNNSSGGQAYPKPVSCQDAWQSCQQRLDECLAAGQGNGVCVNENTICQTNSSNQNEEYTGVFRQILQERLAGRLYAIGFGNYKSNTPFSEQMEHRRNFLIDLTADNDQVYSGPMNRLLCSDNRSVRYAGTLQTPDARDGQIIQAAWKVIWHAKDKIRAVSQRPHLSDPIEEISSG